MTLSSSLAQLATSGHQAIETLQRKLDYPINKTKGQTIADSGFWCAGAGFTLNLPHLTENLLRSKVSIFLVHLGLFAYVGGSFLKVYEDTKDSIQRNNTIFNKNTERVLLKLVGKFFIFSARMGGAIVGVDTLTQGFKFSHFQMASGDSNASLTIDNPHKGLPGKANEINHNFNLIHNLSSKIDNNYLKNITILLFSLAFDKIGRTIINSVNKNINEEKIQHLNAIEEV